MVVRKVHLDSTFLTYPDSLFTAFNYTSVTISDMPYRDAIVLGNSLANSNQLLCIGVTARAVIKSSRKSEGALLHTLNHQFLHLLQFFGCSCSVNKPHYLQSESIVRHEVSYINCHPAVKPGKIFTDRIPIPSNVWVAIQCGKVAPH